MAYHAEMKVKGDEVVQPEARHTLIIWLNRCKICINVVFYDNMDFRAGQRLAITKAIIEFVNSLFSNHQSYYSADQFVGGSGLAQRRPRRGNRFDDNVMVFYR